MKLTTGDIETLKQASLISPNLRIPKGSKRILTISLMKCVMFEREFSNVVSKTNDVLIYDLNEFLRILKVLQDNSTHKDVELNCDSQFIYLKSGQDEYKYKQSSKDRMSIPTKEVECETLNYKFHIDSQVISLSKKFKNLFDFVEITRTSKDSKYSFNVTFKNVLDKDRVYNSFTKVITNTLTPLKYLPKHFKFVFRVHNLAMLDDSWWYDVKLSSQKLSQFKNSSVNYFVAMEPTSEFEKPTQLINKKKVNQKKIISLSNNIAKLQKQLSVLRSA